MSAPTDAAKPGLRLIECGGAMDAESLAVFEAFCRDPLSDRTGALIDALVARRKPRGVVRVVRDEPERE